MRLAEADMTEQDALDFVRNCIGSIWALEVLVLLGAEPKRRWSLDQIVRESRSSRAAVKGGLALLAGAGLVAQIGDSEYRYNPQSPTLDTIGDLVQKLYSNKPTTVIAAIYQSPNEKLRTFAEAFELKE